jgi:uracil-DNA glycosylase family 4
MPAPAPPSRAPFANLHGASGPRDPGGMIVPRFPPHAPFAALCAEAAACIACPRMAGRRRVLSDACGPVPASLMLVGEAPGRRGADRTGVPFSGDAAGGALAMLLAQAGLTRDAIFLTNAVLCNPRDAAGRNAPPTRTELMNCAGFLARQIAWVNPEVVAPLGRVALGALGRLSPHGRTLADAGVAVPWNGRVLFPLYHPSPRARRYRSVRRQRADFRRLAALLPGV